MSPFIPKKVYGRGHLSAPSPVAFQKIKFNCNIQRIIIYPTLFSRLLSLLLNLAENPVNLDYEPIQPTSGTKLYLSHKPKSSIKPNFEQELSLN